MNASSNLVKIFSQLVFLLFSFSAIANNSADSYFPEISKRIESTLNEQFDVTTNQLIEKKVANIEEKISINLEANSIIGQTINSPTVRIYSDYCGAETPATQQESSVTNQFSLTDEGRDENRINTEKSDTLNIC